MTEQVTLPDMTLDLTPFRLLVNQQDFGYIDKHNGRDAALEAWSQKTVQFAQVIEHYLDEASGIPNSIRGQLQDIVNDALNAEQAIRYQIASVRLPEINSGNALQLMRVSADASKYEVVSPEQLFSEWLGELTIAAAKVAQSPTYRFVTDAEKNNWNNNAASKISQNSSYRFVNDSEKAAWSSRSPDRIDQDSNNRFVTDAEKARWSNVGSGEIGTYVWARTNSLTYIAFGDIVAGSLLRPSGFSAPWTSGFTFHGSILKAYGSSSAMISNTSQALTGSWRAMGCAEQFASDDTLNHTLWVRIA